MFQNNKYKKCMDKITKVFDSCTTIEQNKVAKVYCYKYVGYAYNAEWFPTKKYREVYKLPYFDLLDHIDKLSNKKGF